MDLIFLKKEHIKQKIYQDIDYFKLTEECLKICKFIKGWAWLPQL